MLAQLDGHRVLSTTLGNNLEVLQVQNGCEKAEMRTLSLVKVELSKRSGGADASGVASATGE
ncbi:hypothetical protein AZE42_02421 [Rhizopogon vesiculosus]|uniref:Uncharacterized protein n=1 Tax=Rhizopogon vesiculosus TaxID=180088 RepID=A0A1J8PUC7_9AGAM|nr:hypothetical protein AZE42_02421 [Rhizopogon vesiculosus]